MKYFSVPADFKLETLDRFYELNNTYDHSKIIETYGQFTTGNIINSGRITEVLPEVDFKLFQKYVAHSRERNIEFNYTLNPSCFGNIEFSETGIMEINALLEKLYDVGVQSITVTSPPLIELIQASRFKFKIKASAICEITSPSKALFYKNLGVERIVIDPDITRDFNNIKNICRVFGNGVEMIVNNVCYKNCAYKMFHYNHESHCTCHNTNQSIRDYYFNRCSMQKASKANNVMRLNWVRPEDIKYYYEAGLRFFKIQGRQNVLQGDIVNTLKHYFREDFEGNLFDLITIFAPYNTFQPYIDNKKLEGFVYKFYSNPGFCTDVCSSCGYCEMYAKKSMDIEKVELTNKDALSFYQGYDRYSKAIKEVKTLQPVKKLFDETDLDCEFNLD